MQKQDVDPSRVEGSSEEARATCLAKLKEIDPALYEEFIKGFVHTDEVKDMLDKVASGAMFGVRR